MITIDQDYLETHFEVCARIGAELEHDLFNTVVANTYAERGRGGLYELAKELTDEFQEKFKDHQWDGDFFDELEDFLDEKL
jgi:hypothetical protein